MDLVEAFVSDQFYEERTVFVTSETFDGNLGGTLADGDDICQFYADQAGLDGVFEAWLSDATGSPASRFGRGGSFILVDGTLVAKHWPDLTDGSLRHAIDLTELGTTLSAGAMVWTNTRTDGSTLGADDCGGWGAFSGLGAVGWADRSDAAWTEPAGNPTALCGDGGQHLYCFESETFKAPNSQTLTLVGNSLLLTSNDGTDSVDLTSYTDNQVLSLSGDQLQLTSEDGTDSVDLSGYIDTDNQVLSLSGDQLQLTSEDGTDSVDLSGYTNTDNQVLSLSGNQLQLTSDDGTDLVDLSTYVDTDHQTYPSAAIP
ncbi:MAG: hypothetical protein AAGF23_05545 [Acidobacteriota bacterium]